MRNAVFTSVSSDDPTRSPDRRVTSYDVLRITLTRNDGVPVSNQYSRNSFALNVLSRLKGL